MKTTEPSKYKYIYGPVSSWRLGRSLGIDPISSIDKTCTFDCVYCQTGGTKTFPKDREVFVPTKDLEKELRSMPKMELDYITFAGNGEPTLAKNLGEMIRMVKKVRKEPVAVITHASLIARQDVQEDLLEADLVEAKLDADCAETFRAVNHPMPEVEWEEIVEGLEAFRKVYKGYLTFQIMFIKSNQAHAEGIARLAWRLEPDEIEINTPLRACGVKPLLPETIAEITEIFRKECGSGAKIRNVYEAKREKSAPICSDATARRRGKETG